MKLICNTLPIGAPGTEHIRWESVGRWIARYSEHIADSRVRRWSKPKRQAQRPYANSAN